MTRTTSPYELVLDPQLKEWLLVDVRQRHTPPIFQGEYLEALAQKNTLELNWIQNSTESERK